MGFFGSGRRTPPRLGPTPTFATRAQIIDLYLRYRGSEPSEAEIQSHLGNPGGAPAIEILLQQSAPPPTAPLPSPPLPPPEPPRGSSGAGGRPIKVTDAQDGELINRGYGYYSQAWIDPLSQQILCFVGMRGARPEFFQVDRRSGQVSRRGSLLRFPGEAEGWTFDTLGRILLPDGPSLRRVDPRNPNDESVLLDVSQTHPGCDLWQAHTSDDGRTSSATVRQITASGAYPLLGTVVSVNGSQRWFPVEREPLDESALTTDGRWLVIKEGPGPDNKIVDLQSGAVRWILDGERALGHSDAGRDFMVGEADQPDPGGCGLWHYPTMDFRFLYRTLNLGHLSLRGQRGIVVDDQTISRLDLSSGQRTPLLDHGMTVPPGTPDWQKYDFQVMANLDPTGSLIAYLSNVAGRMDLYLYDLDTFGG